MIQKGSIDICVNVEGKEKLIARFGPGDHFGERSVLGGSKVAQVSAIGHTEASVVLIPLEKIQAILDRDPQLQAKMLKNLMQALDIHLTQTKSIITTLLAKQKRGI